MSGLSPRSGPPRQKAEVFANEGAQLGFGVGAERREIDFGLPVCRLIEGVFQDSAAVFVRKTAVDHEGQEHGRFVAGGQIEDVGEGVCALCGGKIGIKHQGSESAGRGGVVGRGDAEDFADFVFGEGFRSGRQSRRKRGGFSGLDGTGCRRERRYRDVRRRFAYLWVIGAVKAPAGGSGQEQGNEGCGEITKHGER